jgi:hypothetical protein
MTKCEGQHPAASCTTCAIISERDMYVALERMAASK